MSKTTFNILAPAAAAKLVSKIGRVGKALQGDIHVVAVSTLDHIRQHGDYTVAIALLNALPNGQRVKAVAEWYRRFSTGKAVFSYDKSNVTWKCKLAPNRDDSDFQIAEAMKVDYASLNPEKGYSTLTFKGFQEFLKRKANEDGMNPDGSPKVEAEVRRLAQQFYAEIANATSEKQETLDEILPDAEAA